MRATLSHNTIAICECIEQLSCNCVNYLFVAESHHLQDEVGVIQYRKFGLHCCKAAPTNDRIQFPSRANSEHHSFINALFEKEGRSEISEAFNLASVGKEGW